MRAATLGLMMFVLASGGASAAEPPALARARTLYNTADYDGAIAAAVQARVLPAGADAGALVEARAYLERYRRTPDPSDLAAARDALQAVRPGALSPRDHVDLLVGLGQSLYLDERYGAAADLFDTALDHSARLSARDRLLLLDWWATALDRQAQSSAPEHRDRLYARIEDRMDDELRRDPGSAPANYWRVVAGRGLGNLEAAWDAAVAAWVRATLTPPSAPALRADIDRLVTDALIPERVYARPLREQDAAADTFRAQWDLVKQQWK